MSEASAGADWDALDSAKYADEDAAIRALLAEPPLSPEARGRAGAEARALVIAARALKRRKGVMESFLEEFGLSTAEGLALMCLAETLLRVPDEATADALIAERVQAGDWAAHLGRSDDWLVNAGAWGLMLTGRFVTRPDPLQGDVGAFFSGVIQRLGEPVVRAAAMQAMRILGEQFVLGRDIDSALKRGQAMIRDKAAARFSFDMLGEGARAEADSERYEAAYAGAIDAVGAAGGGNSVSVKLSALDPRYEARKQERVFAKLYPRLKRLAVRAKQNNVALSLDAEEADRLVLSLQIFERLLREPELQDWDGLGIVVQAYQKRARGVIARLGALTRGLGRKIHLRLVKGAYWDSEIKRAQAMGRPDFPVFTTKPATDTHYLACARDLFALSDCIFPQFATHNAFTVAAVRELAREAGCADYEFQRLHGMGEALYAALDPPAPVRVYAPVGGHEDLLPYLVRRLLENGANTSFVHAFLDEDVAPELVAADPIAALRENPHRHPKLPPPPLLYGPERRNPIGRDLSIKADREALASAEALAFSAPASTDDAIGAALAAQSAWDGLGGNERAFVLREIAHVLDEESDALAALIVEEARRTWQDAIDEVREAVDFCRYYASEAERLFAAPMPMAAPAGEDNRLELHGRGVFVCISPWNFPLAIFTGQIMAALAAGNSVAAKPAEQTPRIAEAALALFREAGLPRDVLRLVQGDGAIGANLVRDERIAGVAFTGSTEAARAIHRDLAAREGGIPVFIAETGGLNGMFVDTTALKEQVVDDVIVSAFGSAGQRCSSLRILFLPHAIAEGFLATLSGAMDALSLGDPADPATDIGPIIDAEAKARLDAHMARMRAQAKIVKQIEVSHLGGTYFGPALVEIGSLDLIERETFGPILHVLRYDPAEIASLGAALAAKGYGLTLGVHSRLDSFAKTVRASVPVGNVYINRAMIGAVPGMHPFGGRGLSGTGPKAGGPFYLQRFAEERVISVNTAAQGGDPKLLNL